MRWAILCAVCAACGSSSDASVPTPSDPGDGGSSASSGEDGAAETSTPAGDAGGEASVAEAGTDAPEAGTDGATAASRKRGLAYGYNSDADLAALSAGISWFYNWSPKPDATLVNGNPNVEFVPMIWGGTFDTATLDKQVPQGAKYLLTFNEPNFGTQSNLTPAQAAALWPKIESFAKARGMKIVSPAVNYCGSPCNDTDPFDWLQKFFAACTGCQVDYIAMHWYACDKPAIVNTLAKYETFGKELWVTEFSCLDDKSKVTDAGELAYMKDAVAALEADPMVFRYAWFTGRSTNSPPISLLAASGQLTPLGTQYVTLPR